MLETRENQETELQNPNWWHELSTILLGKLQGKEGLGDSHSNLVVLGGSVTNINVFSYTI